MMRKYLLCLVAFMLATISVDAAPVDRQQAMAVARKFLTEKGVAVGQLNASAKGMARAKANGTQPYYVFNNENGGFAIVSGDDRAPLVLGYSKTGTFGEENVPENISAWLNNYEEQIEALGSGTQAMARAKQADLQKARVSISPLVMTHWNQYAPYFNETPTRNGTQCLTGCVATAFAQIMKYHECPKTATTVVPGYTWNGTTLEDLPATTFDWANMLYDYQGGGNASAGCSDDAVYQAAVAKLMKYCGYAVEASYGTGSTSASSSLIPAAMKNYFGYEGNIKEVDRSAYGTTEWEDLIYDELYQGRPVLYSGRNSGGGHAFICDGYGEDHYFHINWGWGGMSDGYYLLSILEPDKQGAGGTNSGYSQSQSIIIGIQPGADTAETTTTGPCLKLLNFILTDYNASYVEQYGPQWFGVGYQLQGLMDGDHQLNAQLLQDGVVKYEGSLLDDDPWGIDLGVNYYNPRTIVYPFFHNKSLADGTYEVRLVCRMKEEGKEYDWVPCQGSENYKNEVTISNGTVTYSNTKLAPQIACSSFSTPAKIYVNNKSNGVATLVNSGAVNFQGMIYLWINGTVAASDMAYVDAGKTFDMSFAFTPNTTGSLPVKITTDASGQNAIYEGSINVVEESASAKHKLELTAWTFDNADDESKKICGGTVSGTMTVTNTGDKTYSGNIAIGYSSSDGWMGMSYRSYTLAPGESVTLEYTKENPELGISYQLVCWEDADWSKRIGQTERYELIAGGYTYWTADGTAYNKADDGNSNVAVVADAVAVKFFVTPTGAITPNANPNTLYYFSGENAPASLDGKNVILNGHIDNVVFNDGYSFYVPLGFTAANATYSRIPKLGANGSTGWETIVIPFAAQKAINQTDNKQIRWFVSRTDDDKDFWLKSFAYTDGETAYFDFVDEIRANVPYIIATPGDKWGKQYDLRNKTIAFTAEDVNIPQTSKIKAMTDAFDFVGLSEHKTVSGYVLDEKGQYFTVQSGVEQDAFRAYFTINADSQASHAPRLKIGTYIPDGIKKVESVANGVADVYSVNGTKVGTVRVCNGMADMTNLPNGVYIVNGKKVMK